MKTAIYIIALSLLAGCGDHLGKPPDFSPEVDSREFNSMMSPGLPQNTRTRSVTQQASLWTASQTSLLGDRRAMQRGDILTVVVEIDESAEISNSTSRSRSGSESLGITEFFGIPQRINNDLSGDANLDDAVGIDSSSSSSGDGSVSRNEQLTLRIAATVVDVLPNGVLSIQGNQEVRVNFELRELLVSGFVRPEDISRQNEITYDKIASARVSYGGRGQITDVQQPRIGQQIVDRILPF
ncbi:flagellar basal body L-ring protein FlgH [Pseudooceanicola algae]|uniref:Flagellar L-ring protein n=1 Tax=Pseudooceanicola algae TaxID=1537215 RepID=A0A418SAY6_9RHOB|nr:flagellar basal body L-ring protein FlgH [Pseudooceanicola algae]QPM91286.1 Flagellar L-ring protein [Pseudooceanicola algae]